LKRCQSNISSGIVADRWEMEVVKGVGGLGVEGGRSGLAGDVGEGVLLGSHSTSGSVIWLTLVLLWYWCLVLYTE
jgi:hypothetical protein